MAEGYVNLFDNYHEGTNRPHFRGFIKIDGVDHEFALWPNKDGKKGYSGKYKPKEERIYESSRPSTGVKSIVDEAKEQFPGATALDSDIPF